MYLTIKLDFVHIQPYLYIQPNEFIFQGGMQQTQIFTLTALLKNDIKGILRSFIN